MEVGATHAPKLSQRACCFYHGNYHVCCASQAFSVDEYDEKEAVEDAERDWLQDSDGGNPINKQQVG